MASPHNRPYISYLTSPLSPSMLESLLSSRQSSSSDVQPSRPSMCEIWLSTKLARLRDGNPVRFWSRRMCRRSRDISVMDERSTGFASEEDAAGEACSRVGREWPGIWSLDRDSSIIASVTPPAVSEKALRSDAVTFSWSNVSSALIFRRTVGLMGKADGGCGHAAWKRWQRDAEVSPTPV